MRWREFRRPWQPAGNCSGPQKKTAARKRQEPRTHFPHPSQTPETKPVLQDQVLSPALPALRGIGRRLLAEASLLEIPFGVQRARESATPAPCPAATRPRNRAMARRRKFPSATARRVFGLP